LMRKEMGWYSKIDGAFQIVALTCVSWIASFLPMTATHIVIARNEAILKKENDNLNCTQN